MARCTVSLLTKSVSVDPFTNTLTAIDIAESLVITASEIPTASEANPHLIRPFNWVFLAVFTRDDLATPEEAVGRLTILSPQERAFPGPEQRIDLATAENARSLTMIPSFPYTGNGVYRLRYEVSRNEKWQTVSECLLPMAIKSESDVTTAL
jgi:hypothetical protein